MKTPEFFESLQGIYGIPIYRRIGEEETLYVLMTIVSKKEV
jgi:hypothetical protein